MKYSTKPHTKLRTDDRSFRRAIVLPAITSILALAFLPSARAVDPPPDGGYANENTAEGEDALFSLDTGTHNTALGFEALYFNTSGAGNTATGFWALYANTTGVGNTANGDQALRDNTGDSNTAFGFAALGDNTTASSNTAVGSLALTANTTGDQNVALGTGALESNTVGYANTATGLDALTHNTYGNRNTADGYNALLANTGGKRNTASGSFALYSNTTGNHNAALGWSALLGNTTGNRNIGLGDGAGQNLTTGDSNIDIGNSGAADESQTIRIGTQGTHTAAYVAGVSGSTVADGVGVVVGADGHLGTILSSARFKEQIKPMNKASEAILSLKPVTFRYKKGLDPKGVPQFGLVAEEVAKIAPALVARDDKGEPYTVRYDAVNAMLLNEFLKEHRKMEEEVLMNRKQERIIVELKSALARQNKELASVKLEQQAQIDILAATVKEQANQMQKVAAKLSAMQPTPRVVAK